MKLLSPKYLQRDGRWKGASIGLLADLGYRLRGFSLGHKG